MSEMFTCKYCGDNLPVRCGAEMADGQRICPECGCVIHLWATRKKDEEVLLTTKYPLLGTATGFSNITALNHNFDMDRVRKNCPDLKEIPVNREEMVEVSSCVDKQFEVDPYWNTRYSAYKALAYRIVKIMEVKPLDDEQLKSEVEDFWKQYIMDFILDKDARELVKEKTDFEALQAMIAEIE